ncbi:MAG TPA: HAD family hydrolase [Alcaligenaceae bacterium]|nr:HAD family hydrolase [Alcaligenaceae bacterium]
MKPYSVVIFDWDGTLMDSTHSIVTAIQGACRDLELPVPTPAEASWVIGLSLEPALRRAVPDLTKSMEPLFLERYRYHYLARDTKLKLFDGVPEMLDELRAAGATLAVATGKSRVGLNRALSSTELHNRFAATRCADETFGKPHPAMLHELMDELMVDPQEVVMVGDTSHDLNMASNAGVHGLGVTYGAHPEEELRNCTNHGIVGDIPSLRAWLMDRIKPV